MLYCADELRRIMRNGQDRRCNPQIARSDARAPVSAIAAQVGLSQSACTRRIQALEAFGAHHRLWRATRAQAAGLPDHRTWSTSRSAPRSRRIWRGSNARCGDRRQWSNARWSPAVRTIGSRSSRSDLDDYERLHREHLGRLPGVVTINSSFVLRAVPTRSEADALFAGK
jgi:Lrp/AsnC family leucine-responsive transcriptional regulator